jgi:hypothetical protein
VPLNRSPALRSKPLAQVSVLKHGARRLREAVWIVPDENIPTVLGG